MNIKYLNDNALKGIVGGESVTDLLAGLTADPSLPRSVEEMLAGVDIGGDGGPRR